MSWLSPDILDPDSAFLHGKGSGITQALICVEVRIPCTGNSRVNEQTGPQPTSEKSRGMLPPHPPILNI